MSVGGCILFAWQHARRVRMLREVALFLVFHTWMGSSPSGLPVSRSVEH